VSYLQKISRGHIDRFDYLFF